MDCFLAPYGYYIDFSRTFRCPENNSLGNKNSRKFNEQKTLYNYAFEQVEYNMSLIKDGLSFSEFTEKAWKIPQRYVKNRYHVMTHGVGMTGEYPYIFHDCDWQQHGYHGVIQEGMTLCVESFIGDESGFGEGVKLEQHVVVTKNGCINLSCNIPYDSDLLANV